MISKAQGEALVALLGQLRIPGEQWAAVAGYEQTYRVSSLGRVLSIPRPRTRGGLLKASPDNYGYPRVALVEGGTQRSFRVHILVARAFIGAPPEGQEVRHLDGSRDPRLSNLAYGTHKENGEDASRHGVCGWRGRLTHCKHGHAFDEANTYRPTEGGRQCCKCALMRYHAKRLQP